MNTSIYLVLQTPISNISLIGYILINLDVDSVCKSQYLTPEQKVGLMIIDEFCA